MKVALVLAAAILTAGAANGDSDKAAPAPAERAAPMPNAHALHEATCQDRISQTRAERGLPELQRDTASPEKPLFYAAVDHRLEGCGVLVMRHDLQDIRPVPVIPRNQPLFRRAR